MDYYEGGSMTKYICNPRGCRFAPCTIETHAAMRDEDMLWCPVEDEASWYRVKEIAKDQAVLFLL